MKPIKPLHPPNALHDYQPALQGALSWLGDRYLLAEPVNRRSEPFKAEANPPKSLHTVPLRVVTIG